MASLHRLEYAPRKNAAERNFALLFRGGGHGAFAAGSLDALLAHGIGVDAIGAAGVGVANAVAIAFGLALGGNAAAQRSLRALWRHAGTRAGTSNETGGDRAALESALSRLIDFDRLRAAPAVPLFIAARNARSGEMRLFAGREITRDVVLAAMAPESHARDVDGVCCAAGTREELAALPLLGQHKASEIIAPFLSPLRLRHLDRIAMQDVDEAMGQMLGSEVSLTGRHMHPLPSARLWSLGRIAAHRWLKVRAQRLRRQAPIHDEPIPNLAA